MQLTPTLEGVEKKDYTESNSIKVVTSSVGGSLGYNSSSSSLNPLAEKNLLNSLNNFHNDGSSLPLKRPSIDDSWVNVDWSEVSSKSGELASSSPPTQSPSSRREYGVVASQIDRETQTFSNYNEKVQHNLSPSALQGQQQQPETIDFKNSIQSKEDNVKERVVLPPMESLKAITNVLLTSLEEIEESNAQQSVVLANLHQTTKAPESSAHDVKEKIETSPLESKIISPLLNVSSKEEKEQGLEKDSTLLLLPFDEKPTLQVLGGGPSEKMNRSNLACCSNDSLNEKDPLDQPAKIPETETSKAASSPSNDDAFETKIGEEFSTMESSNKITDPDNDNILTPKTSRTSPVDDSSPKATPPRSSGRQRKSVDRLSPKLSDYHFDTKVIEIPDGCGTRLVDIVHISKELSKRKSDYAPILTLHRIIFGRQGESSKRKANLRQFNGLKSETDLEGIIAKLMHHTVEELRKVCDLLNLDKNGEKKIISGRIANFLIKPVDFGDSKRTLLFPKKRSMEERSKSPSSAPTIVGNTHKLSKVESPKKSPKSESFATSEYDKNEEVTGSEEEAEMLANLKEDNKGKEEMRDASSDA